MGIITYGPMGGRIGRRLSRSSRAAFSASSRPLPPIEAKIAAKEAHSGRRVSLTLLFHHKDRRVPALTPEAAMAWLEEASSQQASSSTPARSSATPIF